MNANELIILNFVDFLLFHQKQELVLKLNEIPKKKRKTESNIKISKAYQKASCVSEKKKNRIRNRNIIDESHKNKNRKK